MDMDAAYPNGAKIKLAEKEEVAKKACVLRMTWQQSFWVS